MAREFKLEVKRGLVDSVLYYHDDNMLELVDSDSGEVIEYLQIKLNLAKDLFAWMKKYGVQSFECVEVV